MRSREISNATQILTHPHSHHTTQEAALQEQLEALRAKKRRKKTYDASPAAGTTSTTTTPATMTAPPPPPPPRQPPRPQPSRPQPRSSLAAPSLPSLPVAIPVATGKIAKVHEQIRSPYCNLWPFECFNAVQSECFNAAACSSANMVVSAPTGCGKTVLIELAILQLISSAGAGTAPANYNFKIVFLAPIKALCQEKVTRDPRPGIFLLETGA